MSNYVFDVDAFNVHDVLRCRFNVKYRRRLNISNSTSIVKRPQKAMPGGEIGFAVSQNHLIMVFMDGRFLNISEPCREQLAQFASKFAEPNKIFPSK